MQKPHCAGVSLTQLVALLRPVTCREHTCMSCEEEDTCMSCEEEDTCMPYEEKDTCMPYEEEDTCMCLRMCQGSVTCTVHTWAGCVGTGMYPPPYMEEDTYACVRVL